MHFGDELVLVDKSVPTNRDHFSAQIDKRALAIEADELAQPRG